MYKRKQYKKLQTKKQ